MEDNRSGREIGEDGGDSNQNVLCMRMKSSNKPNKDKGGKFINYNIIDIISYKVHEE